MQGSPPLLGGLYGPSPHPLPLWYRKRRTPVRLSLTVLILEVDPNRIGLSWFWWPNRKVRL